MLSPRRERIVYTRHDGKVSICIPSANCIRWMGTGGRWANQPRGFLEVQVERNMTDGIPEYAAVRFCRALVFGGLTDKEALEAIRDRDCAHRGTGIELWDMADVPSDRWFRNAWRRSHNGGPINIDMHAARRIQLDKIKRAVAERNGKRINLGRRPIEVAWGTIGNAIRHAVEPDELRRVWPEHVVNYPVT